MQNVPILEIVISIVCLILIIEIVYIVINSKKNKYKHPEENIVHSQLDDTISPIIVVETVANNKIIYSEGIIEDTEYSPSETMPVYPSEEDWTPCSQPEPVKSVDNWFLASDFSEVQGKSYIQTDTYPPSEPSSYSYSASDSSSTTTSD